MPIKNTEIECLTAEIESTAKNTRVAISHIGEGFGGDYDEEDSGDVPLLRIDVMRLGKHGGEDVDDDEWGVVRNGSFCTNIDARIGASDVQEIADHLAKVLDGAPLSGIPSVGRLSWIESKDEALKTCFVDGSIVLGREVVGP